MKASILLLAGGLVLAGTAVAGDPAPQSNVAAPGLKVGIDKATGKVRPLTMEESAALDAQAQRDALSNAAAHAGQPATMDEAMSNIRSSARIPSIQGFRMPAEMMSSLTVTRNADGTVTFAENGQPLESHNKTQEAARE